MTRKTNFVSVRIITTVEQWVDLEDAGFSDAEEYARWAEKHYQKHPHDLEGRVLAVNTTLSAAPSSTAPDLRMRRKRVTFHLQPTRSFPDGAPQREEYDTDTTHKIACQLYASEWRQEYECPSYCKNVDCPQHGKAVLFRGAVEEKFKRWAQRCPHKDHGQRICVGCSWDAFIELLDEHANDIREVFSKPPG